LICISRTNRHSLGVDSVFSRFMCLP